MQCTSPLQGVLLVREVNQVWRERLTKYFTMLNIAIALGYVGLVFVAAHQGLLWRADFTAYYTGAAIIRDGEGAHLYDLDLQTVYQQNILGGRSFLGGLLPYNSPPHLALFLVPLSFLPLSTAFWVWVLLNALMVGGCLAYVWRLADRWARAERRLFLSVILALPSLFRTILQGTSSLVALFCVLHIYWTIKKGKHVSAGAALALGTLRPQAVFPIGFFALIQRRWRTLFATGFFVLCLLVLTSLALGPRVWLDFLASMGRTGELSGQLGVYPEVMPNLRGGLSLLLGPEQAYVVNILGWSGFFLYLLAMMWFWRHRIPLDSPLFELKLALGLASGVFFSFHLNPHDALLLVLPMLLILRYLQARERPLQPAMTWLGGLPSMLLISEFLVPAPFGSIGSMVAVLGLVAWDSSLLYGEVNGL